MKQGLSTSVMGENVPINIQNSKKSMPRLVGTQYMLNVSLSPETGYATHLFS